MSTQVYDVRMQSTCVCKGRSIREGLTMGMEDGSVSFMNEPTEVITAVPLFNSPVVSVAHCGEEKNVWAAAQTGSLSKLEFGNDEPSVTIPALATEQEDISTMSVFGTDVWVGGVKGSVIVLNDESASQRASLMGHAHPIVVIERLNDMIVVVSSDGVITGWKEDTLESVLVSAVGAEVLCGAAVEDQLWLGSDNGVHVISTLGTPLGVLALGHVDAIASCGTRVVIGCGTHVYIIDPDDVPTIIGSFETPSQVLDLQIEHEEAAVSRVVAVCLGRVVCWTVQNTEERKEIEFFSRFDEPVYAISRDPETCRLTSHATMTSARIEACSPGLPLSSRLLESYREEAQKTSQVFTSPYVRQSTRPVEEAPDYQEDPELARALNMSSE